MFVITLNFVFERYFLRRIPINVKASMVEKKSQFDSDFHFRTFIRTQLSDCFFYVLCNLRHTYSVLQDINTKWRASEFNKNVNRQTETEWAKYQLVLLLKYYGPLRSFMLNLLSESSLKHVVNHISLKVLQSGKLSRYGHIFQFGSYINS